MRGRGNGYTYSTAFDILNMVYKTVSASSQSFIEMQNLRPYPDLPNQNIHFKKFQVMHIHIKDWEALVQAIFNNVENRRDVNSQVLFLILSPDLGSDA